MENNTAATLTTNSSDTTQQAGWVICRTTSYNWDEDRMDFADYSQVVYDLYVNREAAQDGEPFETISNEEFQALKLAVAWGEIYPEYPVAGGEISQGGAVR